MKFICCAILIGCSFSIFAQRGSKLNVARIVFTLPDTLRGLQFYTEFKAEGAGNVLFATHSNLGSLGLSRLRNEKFMSFSPMQKGYCFAAGIGIDTTNIKGWKWYRWKYDWQEGAIYKLLVTAIVDSAKKSTIVASYIYLPEKSQWKFIVSHKTTDTAAYLQLSELFVTRGKQNKKDRRETKLTMQQTWIQRRNGSWKQLVENTFVAKAGKFVNGTDSGRIFITDWVTDRTGDNSPVKTDFQSPLFSLTSHIDSLEQTKVDKAEIFAAVSSKKIDTSGSVNDVYYNILQEGTGPLVNVTDTLSVFYKGWLLSNGQVFDQTKEDPASFPLSRLIKGWQFGLTRCRVGGKIRLFIPSGLAYSVRSRSKDIPPNSVLVFDIEVKEASPKL